VLYNGAVWSRHLAGLHLLAKGRIEALLTLPRHLRPENDEPARDAANGAVWPGRGTAAIPAPRCCRLSGRFEDYWKSRSRAAGCSSSESRTRLGLSSARSEW
jgi:hypothetical protein